MDGFLQQQTNEEKHKIFKQLCDMFTNINPSQLRVVCEQNNWDVDSCLDFLVNSEQNLNLMEPTTTTKMPTDGDDNQSVSFAIPYQYPNTQNGGGAIPKVLIADQRMHKSAFTPYRHQTQQIPQKQYINNNSKTITEEMSLKTLLIGSSTPCTDATTLRNRAEQRILANVERGHKIMVLMRGVPGSGKSHLAKSILKRCPEPYQQYSSNDFIMSTDSYFIVRGVYRHLPERLPEYHENNLRRTEECCQYGFSPLIIDNTNTKVWEMKPYVMLALRYGYILEILIPDTPWRNSAGKLAMKNTHGVPKDKIARMLDNFETCSTSMELLKEFKMIYEITLPQYRNYPPFTPPNISCLGASFNKFNSEPQSQPQQNNTQQIKEDYLVDDQKKEQIPLLALLKNDNNDSEVVDVMQSNTITDKLERHSVDCSKENIAFVNLRQIYPNCDITGLWDLFVKCNGDAEWCVDLMLNDDDLSITFEQNLNIKDAYNCYCDADQNSIKKIKRNKSNKKLNELLPTPAINNNNNNNTEYNNNQNNNQNKSKNPAHKHTDKNAKLQTKANVENLFQVDEQQYSEHVRRVRGWRKKNNNNNDKSNQRVEKCDIEIVDVDDDDDVDVDDDIDIDNGNNGQKEMLKISLGSNLIEQLSNEFSADLPLSDFLPKDLSQDVDVFVPRSMAKELYLMYAESIYNIMEEQRAQTMREDEDFARLLTLPQFEECQTSPPNMKEILAALNTQEQQFQQQQQQVDDGKNAEKYYDYDDNINFVSGNVGMDLATQLTLDKLCDEFPNIPRETLQEILLANKQNYYNTVDLLNNTNNSTSSSTYMVRSEGSGRSMPQDNAASKSSTPTITSNSSGGSGSGSYVNSIKRTNSKTTMDEQKRNAITDFEKSRNLAAHHSRLKFECYRKAKEAIQRNNHGAALYYSEVARMHLSKIDHYNHQSANCIMNVHKLTTSNPELLDMHYLHLDEALACLDIFLDRHIATLRYNKRPYKCVFIITGRGKHSATGVSVIKTHVRSRLKERCIRWCEINPGLLKAKLFPTDHIPK